MAAARRVPKDTPGDGDLFELDGRGLVGAALVYDGGVVHVAAFAERERERVQHNNLRFRRERLE
jgi:hypothetical protein